MSIIEPMSSLREPSPGRPRPLSGVAAVPAPAPMTLDAELVRALNEKIAIITGFADGLLGSQVLDESARVALEAIQRQALGLRELFLRS